MKRSVRFPKMAKKERVSNEEVISYVNKNDGHICMTNLEDRRVRRQSES